MEITPIRSSPRTACRAIIHAIASSTRCIASKISELAIRIFYLFFPCCRKKVVEPTTPRVTVIDTSENSTDLSLRIILTPPPSPPKSPSPAQFHCSPDLQAKLVRFQQDIDALDVQIEGLEHPSTPSNEGRFSTPSLSPLASPGRSPVSRLSPVPSLMSWVFPSDNPSP